MSADLLLGAGFSLVQDTHLQGLWVLEPEMPCASIFNGENHSWVSRMDVKQASWGLISGQAKEQDVAIHQERSSVLAVNWEATMLGTNPSSSLKVDVKLSILCMKLPRKLVVGLCSDIVIRSRSLLPTNLRAEQEACHALSQPTVI